MATWSSSSSSPPFVEQNSAQHPLDHFPLRIPVPPRPAPRPVVYEASPEAFGTALLSLEPSDSEEADDNDYIDDGGE